MLPPGLLHRLCTAAALLGALGRPALADEQPGAPATPPLSPPGQVVAPEPPAGPDWNAPPNAPEEEESRWYGNQILIVDAVGVGVLAYALIHEDENAALLGVATLLLGSPVVHGVNGEVGNLLLSLPVRAFLPLAGAFAGIQVSDCYECHTFPVEGLLVGTALGLAAASFIDAKWLARTRPRSEKSSIPSWAPQLGVTGNGFSAGIGGTF